MSADILLSWQGTDGAERCLLIVTDEEKHHNEIGYRTIELCVKEDEQWKTDETLDSIEEIDSFGIPPGVTD